MMRGRRLHPLDKENRDKAELIEGKLCVRMRLWEKDHVRNHIKIRSKIYNSNRIISSSIKAFTLGKSYSITGRSSSDKTSETTNTA